MPMPVPSDTIIIETATAVTAPAMTALHETPLHAPTSPVATGVRATVPPTMVVSSMGIESSLENPLAFGAATGGRQLRMRFHHAIAVVRFMNRPCEFRFHDAAKDTGTLLIECGAAKHRMELLRAARLFIAKQISGVSAAADAKGCVMLNLV